ncbi:MAG: hypothetical protein KIT84_14910 [Labilithrix sp.]|nr:hypothetical protein [Labilithrix sp.]MCW5812313.1 hypothetical protein [Labilithrix sp.]
MALRKNRFLAPAFVVSALGLSAWMAACGSSEGSRFDDGSGNQDDDASFGTSGFGSTTSSGNGSSSGDGSPNDGEQLRIEPATITVKAKGSLTSHSGQQQFTAYIGASTTPVAAIWSVDDAGIGSIEKEGLFHTATFAGKTKVRAQVGNLVGLADVTVSLEIEEDLTAGGGGGGGISEATKTALKAGGNADASNFKWLYPYDKTVFPRGLLAPKLMFGGAAPTAYWVRLSAKNIDYSGFYSGGGDAARVVVSEEWWRTITRSVGANDPVTINVTKIEGADVTGPITETWSIAQGSLKGTVFYNTYNSRIVRENGAEGAIMRLKPGTKVEVFIGSTNLPNETGTARDSKCTVCHSVSANGTALAAALDWGDNGAPHDSAVFTISTEGAATARFVTSNGHAMPFGALSPDGNWLVGSASRSGAWIRGLGGLDQNSRLYDAKTGAIVEDGFFTAAAGRKAVAPSFSPDAKLLAFGDRERNASGRAISILDANLTSSPPSFTNNRELVASNNRVVGWPSFLPDSKAVLYQEGTAYDTGGHRDPPTQLVHYCADLHWVDVATKIPSPLDALNGYRPNGAGGKECYLPFCDVPDPDPNLADPDTACNTEDAHMNYEPTVLPVAVGGYYWVVFTSRRAYGNFLSRQTSSVTPEGDLPFDNTRDTSNAIKGWRKKLWVAAIDINGQPGRDPSHPAFLLEGQETEAGNMRGFWALDPCKANGAGCEAGDECCNGFCRAVSQPDGGTANMCVPPPTGCANDSERCSVNADCCNAPAGTTCINGFCTEPTPSHPR